MMRTPQRDNDLKGTSNRSWCSEVSNPEESLSTKDLLEALESNDCEVRRYAARELAVTNLLNISGSAVITRITDDSIRLGVYEGINAQKQSIDASASKTLPTALIVSIKQDLSSSDSTLAANAFGVFRDVIAQDTNSITSCVAELCQILNNTEANIVRRLESAALLRDSGNLLQVLTFLVEKLPNAAIDVFVFSETGEDNELCRHILRELCNTRSTHLDEALLETIATENRPIAELAEAVTLYIKHKQEGAGVDQNTIDRFLMRIGEGPLMYYMEKKLRTMSGESN